MAHEISILDDGVVEAAYAIKPAWHGLGTVLTEAPDSDTMIRAAHLDWQVNKCPIYYDPTGKGDALKLDDENVATVRMDNYKRLGIVSKKYGVVQNVENFQFLDNLTKDGVMRYESAMALKEGRIVVVLARMPQVDEIVPGDNTHRYVMFQTSHDGTMRLNAIPTNVRVVCANTLALALSNNDTCIEGVRHIGDMTKKMEYLHKMISQFNSAFDDFRDNARKLAGIVWNKTGEGKSAAEKYIQTLFPPVKDEGRARTIRENKVSAVKVALKADRQQLSAISGTWWSLFNAVTEMVDHSSRMSFKGDGRERDENKFLSLTIGEAAKFKQKAYKLALEAAGV